MKIGTITLDNATIIENTISGLIVLFVSLLFTIIWWVIKNNYTTIIIWIKRQKLKFFPANFNIALSFEFEEGLNSGNYFEQIKKNLQKNINHTGLNKHIIIKDFSDIHKFSNKNEAESFRSRKNIDLIIWGDFSRDNLKANNEIVNEIKLYFTYGHPENKEKTIGKMLSLDLSSSLAQKNYCKIYDNNSFEDIKIISNNIFDISMFIIAYTLLLYGHVTKSLELFEKLYNDLLNRKDNFRKKVTPLLFFCYEILIVEYGLNKKNWKLGLNLCSKILKIDNNNFFALSNIAVSQYRLGLEKDAENSVDELLQLYPGNHVTEVNVAFFRILQKRYSNAFKHYRNIINSKETILTQDVIEFLGAEYDNKKEPAFLYGIGVLSFRFWDKKLALRYLSQFIEEASERDYKPMYRKAKEIILKINSLR